MHLKGDDEEYHGNKQQIENDLPLESGFPLGFNPYQMNHKQF